MIESSYDELLAKAEVSSGWHHHYLPPGCALNESDLHKIILEASDVTMYAIFDDKPMPELEKLENLFFGRI